MPCRFRGNSYLRVHCTTIWSNPPSDTFFTTITLFAGLELELELVAGVVWERNTVGWLVAGSWCWSGVRGKHCWAGGCWSCRTECIKRIHLHTFRAPLKFSKHYKSIEQHVNLECDLASTPKSYLPKDMFKSRTSNTSEIQPSPAALSGADSSNISSTQENIGSNKQLLKTRNAFYQTHSVQRSLLAGIH